MAFKIDPIKMTTWIADLKGNRQSADLSAWISSFKADPLSSVGPFSDWLQERGHDDLAKHVKKLLATAPFKIEYFSEGQGRWKDDFVKRVWEGLIDTLFYFWPRDEILAIK